MADDTKCCRTCKHSSDGPVPYLGCGLAAEYLARSKRQFDMPKMPSSVRGPFTIWMDKSDRCGSDCRLYERREP